MTGNIHTSSGLGELLASSSTENKKNEQLVITTVTN